MPSTSPSLLNYLRVVVGVWRDDPRDDAALLARFAEGGDEAAFRVLVGRHGPLVWQTCRRVLGDTPDAEDAFQAVFLALIRKAGRLRREPLAGWLHRVARQAALNVDAGARRRRSLEDHLRAVTQSSAERDVDRTELYVALDEELARLPEQLRVPLILRHLGGRTLEEVSRLVGCSRPVVSKRLLRGEALLRKRLERRGLTVGMGSVAALLGDSIAASAVPARLIGDTARAALRSLSFPLEWSTSATLAEGVMKTMWVTKMKIVTVLLGLTLCLAGGGVLAYQALAGNAVEPFQPAGETRGEAEAPRRTGAVARVDRHGDPLPKGALTRLGTTRLRHTAEIPNGGPGVRSVALSSDGKTVASGGGDGVVRLWEVASGKEIRTLKGRLTCGVGAMAFSLDGKTVVAVGREGTMRQWEAATGKEICTLTLRNKVQVYSVALSPVGKTVATGVGNIDGTNVLLWEAATGKLIHTLQWEKVEGPIASMAFASDGKTVAAGGWNGAVRLWEAATGKLIRTLQEHKSEAGDDYTKIAFSPDGKTVAAGGMDGRVHLWDAATGKEIHTFQAHTKLVWLIAFSSNGKTMATRENGVWDAPVRLWETATGKPVQTLQGPKGMVDTVVFASDGKTVVTGGSDGVVRLWETATGKPIHMQMGHAGSVLRVAFASDGKTVVTGGRDGTVRLWEAATGKEIRTLQIKGQRWIRSMAFAPDGKTVAVGEYNENGGGGGPVRLSETATDKEIRTLKGGSPIMSEAFSPDGKTLATGEKNGIIRLWTTTTGKEIRTLQMDKNNEAVLSVAFSPDGKTLAMGGGNGTVRLLKVATSGEEIRILEPKVRGMCPVTSVIFSPDGKIVATGGNVVPGHDGLVRLWEAATGKEIRTLQGKGEVVTLGFSPDGKSLAASSRDCVQLWDLPSGDAFPPLVGHQDKVLGVAISPDGRSLASVSADTTGLVWDLNSRTVRPATKPDPQALKALWADLASQDALRAWRAVWNLEATPALAVPLVRDRLRPVPADAGKRLSRLVADLDADDFKVRQKAYQELKEIGPDVKPALRKGLEGHPSLEMRKRLEQLLESGAVSYSGEVLRSLRAVAVLEQVGTPQAREVLRALAAGGAGFCLTEEAQAALSRLDKVRQP